MKIKETKKSNNLWITKMHGASNDFIVLDLRKSEAPTAALCRALANRHTGIGCDMVLGVKSPRTIQAVAAYEIWTSEGLPSKQCGNGARCVAAWVIRQGITKESEFFLESPSGIHKVEVLNPESFRIALGIPQFSPKDIPLIGFDKEQSEYEIILDNGASISFSAVSTGNPHAVIEVKDITQAPVKEIGQALQQSSYFSPTVNVGFSEIISTNRIKLRVYEYGAGETLACGSGACAAASVLMKKNRISRKVSVVLPGGELEIDWPENNEQIMLTGPVKFILEGEFFYDTL